MAIENHNGDIVVTGNDIHVVHLMTIRSALGLEIKGLKNSRGSVFRVLQNMGIVDANLKGTMKNKKMALEKLNAIIDEIKNARTCTHRVESEKGNGNADE